MMTSQEYLEAYDRQLRTDAETPRAIAVERLGPLRLVTFAGGRGFVTYQNLGGADAVTIAGWVRGALARCRADAAITRVEWKTRGHDRAPGLHDGQRLDRVLSAHPGAGGAGQGLCYDALHVALVRISGRPDVSAETSHAIAWRSGLADAMALPQTVAVGLSASGAGQHDRVPAAAARTAGRGADAITTRSSPRWSDGGQSWCAPLLDYGWPTIPGRCCGCGAEHLPVAGRQVCVHHPSARTSHTPRYLTPGSASDTPALTSSARFCLVSIRLG